MKKKGSHYIQVRKDIICSGWRDYQLVDTGNRKKLERFGSHHLIRFEPEANWKPSLSKNIWDTADAEYTVTEKDGPGTWKIKTEKSDAWVINVDGLLISLKLSASRHIGIFPEQIENWRWIEERIIASGKKPKILNLFAYTGVASLYAARAGAFVTHVDASRKAIDQCKRSLSFSNMSEVPIRWIRDDVVKFLKKEIRRGNRYQGIIMDPPVFGRGPKGEIWKIENSLDDLFVLCKQVLDKDAILFIITSYNHRFPLQKISPMICQLMIGSSGNIEYGLLLQEEASSQRKIKQAMYARWHPI
jgi:23S rRNA (cytosine1962-C5)-methyltransferase